MVDGLETMPVPRPVALTTSTSASAFAASAFAASAFAASAASAAALASSASSAPSTIASTIDQSASIGVSVWYNLTAFAWAANVTRYAPILEDLVLAGPRIMMKLGSLMTGSEPMAVTVAQHASSATPTADMSADMSADMMGSLADDLSVSHIMEEAASFLAAGDQQQHPDQAVNAQSPPRLMSLDGARGLGSVFNYATSKWALLCIAMAIVLNRTHIFAATRRRLRFRWHVRLLLRIVPIVLFVLQARQLLRSIQCQTSPDFALLRWGDASKSSDLMFAHPNAFLNTMSSAMLLGASDQQSCRAVYMVPPDDPDDVVAHPLQGSLSRLWPLFGTFCLSHFLETVSCAVQGRSLAAETGMTLFEQSLAFAEADAAMSNRFSWGNFPPKPHIPGPAATSENAGTGFALTRSMILRRVNTSPEVLLIAFLSSMTHITSHVLGIFDLQAKYRLLNTGFWGLCFMASIVWSALVFELDDPSSQALWRFPTVCIIGFVPHVLVLAGIVVCVFIYGLGLLLSALVPPANEERSRMSLRQRIGYAHENMQANMSLSEVRITREMDFYAALLRTGFAAITMASEAVYLNEDGGVNLKRHTWLEEARYREAEELQRQWIGMGLSDSRYGQIGAIGLIPVKGGPVGTANGYGRERAAQKVPRGRGDRCLRMGIGASERSSRWLLALDFLLSINKLLARVAALTTLWFLSLLRIRRRPAWLVWLAQGNNKRSEEDAAAAAASLDPAHASQKKGLSGSASGKNEPEPSPPAECIDDVEAEFRRVDQSRDEESLDSDLYKYWLIGGWWGSKDASGDFQPSVDEDDWDVTSVVTMTTNNERDDVTRADADDGAGDEQDSGWTSEDSGQQTPTQRSPQRTRENTPFLDSPLGMRDLARLLRPSNPEEREEAERLAAHLQSDGILTRSGFRRMEKLQRTRILTMPGPTSSSSSSLSLPSSSSPHKRATGPAGPAGPAGPVSRVVKLSPEEEEQLLEQLLLSRRQATTQDDGSGEGDGPPCVVCQCAPRTVIVWPCRCLSLCDDCRVSLAMNNFDKCVCCRRDVMSFSRIYMP